MSRSYKKHPVLKDSPRRSKKFHLRAAAKKVRRAKYEIADGGAYKTLYDRYSICDWRFYVTWKDHLWRAENSEVRFARERGVDPEPVDAEKEYREWRKWYRNK